MMACVCIYSCMGIMCCWVYAVFGDSRAVLRAARRATGRDGAHATRQHAGDPVAQNDAIVAQRAAQVYAAQCVGGVAGVCVLSAYYLDGWLNCARETRQRPAERDARALLRRIK